MTEIHNHYTVALHTKCNSVNAFTRMIKLQKIEFSSEVIRSSLVVVVVTVRHSYEFHGINSMYFSGSS